MLHDLLAGVFWSIGAGLAAGFGVLVAKLPPIQKRWKRRHTTLNQIADQFKPNHGSSLVDRVQRTERNVERIGAHLGIEIETCDAGR